MVVGVRRPMPRRRSGHTTTVTIGAERFCLTANQRDDGRLGEVPGGEGLLLQAVGLAAAARLVQVSGDEVEVP